RRGDLHVVNVIAVPKRLEDAVAKTQYEQVLHGVFAEVVIDAVDLLLIENVKDNLIQFPGGSQVASERFLNDDAHPRIGRGGSRETCAAELLDDVRINFRRC